MVAEPVGEVAQGELAPRIAAARPGEVTGAEGEPVRRFAPRVPLHGLRPCAKRAPPTTSSRRCWVTVPERPRAGRSREPERMTRLGLGARPAGPGDRPVHTPATRAGGVRQCARRSW